jgi:phage terminase large subunit
MTATKTEEGNPLEEFAREYYNQPVRFVEEILGVKPLAYQAEFLNAIASGERKISIRSGHGTGKSTAASWAMLWFLLLRFPNKVVVTAPTSGQLFDALFAELKRWTNELPAALKQAITVKSDRVELNAAPSEAFISARTSRAETPEALAGVHSDNVMLVVDEASGVPEQVFEAAAGSMSGHSAVTIMLSNPTRSSGTFFESQTRLSGSWWTRRWSCVDSPLVSDEFVEEMKLRYGEESNAYRIRVLGEFPLSDDDTIIPFHLVEAATQRDIEVDPDAASVWGLDVARFGTDKTALAKRQGNVITEVSRWQGLDLMQTVGRVKAEYDGLPGNLRPREIMVDVIGMGSGVVDRLRELGLPVRGVNVAEAPSMGKSYINLRAELWFKMRGWLEQRGAKLPKDEQLIAELTSIRYSFASSGKMKAESKDEMRRRGLPSPDIADAVCLTLASDAITALGGATTHWAKPVRRGLKGIA